MSGYDYDGSEYVRELEQRAETAERDKDVLAEVGQRYLEERDIALEALEAIKCQLCSLAQERDEARAALAMLPTGSRCVLCDCRGDEFGDEDKLWQCAECGGVFHWGCSGALDAHPELCDDCANDADAESAIDAAEGEKT